jgi:predicted secreted protein
MGWTSIVAIWLLFWVMGCYIALRFGMKTHDEAGIDKIPGQADSAPAEFSPRRVLLHGTLLAAAAFALYYANWINDWIALKDLDLLGWLVRG